MESNLKIYAPTPKKSLQRNTICITKDLELEIENCLNNAQNIILTGKSTKISNSIFGSRKNSISTRETLGCTLEFQGSQMEELNFEREISLEFEKLSVQNELLGILKPQRNHSNVLERQKFNFFGDSSEEKVYSGSLTPTNLRKKMPPRVTNPFNKNLVFGSEKC